MWILQSEDEDAERRLTFRLGPGAIRTVGRAPRADFIVERPMVSWLHCRLTVEADGTLAVEDLKSTNGTFVNEERVERAVLAQGDRLRVGRVELVVGLAPERSPVRS
jgi:pSer/pThr/pTyr-binding forkhead associated (FHA) protein